MLINGKKRQFYLFINIFYDRNHFDFNKVSYFCRVIKFKIKELCQTLHQE